MGLFDKREPCAICGGKVKALLPWSVEGKLICNDCYGIIDLPDGQTDFITMESFLEYRAFREENAKLKQQFQITEQIDFGWFDTKFLFDTGNRLMCMDKSLNKTIFEGHQIKSFVIREDMAPIFEGSAAGLICHNSPVASSVMAIAPQMTQIRMQQGMMERLESLYDNRDHTYNSTRYIDLPEPFENFVVEIDFDHPYWSHIMADMKGPTFDDNSPSAHDYLTSYNQSFEIMRKLAHALKDIAFPDAPVQKDASAGHVASSYGVSAPTVMVDSVEEIKRFKELMEQGIISEEEFTAKKRQLLGV